MDPDSIYGYRPSGGFRALSYQLMAVTKMQVKAGCAFRFTRIVRARLGLIREPLPFPTLESLENENAP
jgi:hypothetical protein